MTYNFILMNELMDTLTSLNSCELTILAERHKDTSSIVLFTFENSCGSKYIASVGATYISPKKNGRFVWEWSCSVHDGDFENYFIKTGQYLSVASALVRHLEPEQ